MLIGRMSLETAAVAPGDSTPSPHWPVGSGRSQVRVSPLDCGSSHTRPDNGTSPERDNSM